MAAPAGIDEVPTGSATVTHAYDLDSALLDSMMGKERPELWGYLATSRVKTSQTQSTKGQLETSSSYPCEPLVHFLILKTGPQVTCQLDGKLP